MKRITLLLTVLAAISLTMITAGCDRHRIRSHRRHHYDHSRYERDRNRSSGHWERHHGRYIWVEDRCRR